MSTTRRKVLIGLAGLAAAGGAWAVAESFGRDFGLVSSRRSAETIGVAYRAEHGAPDLSTIESLVNATDERALADRLVDRVREDFAAGRIVQIQGWYFSRTEADLCALVARG